MARSPLTAIAVTLAPAIFYFYSLKAPDGDKPGGRAAVVIKNTFLSNSDNASRALRERIL